MPKPRIDSLIDLVTAPYRRDTIDQDMDRYGSVRVMLDAELWLADPNNTEPLLDLDPFGTDDCSCDICTM